MTFEKALPSNPKRWQRGFSHPDKQHNCNRRKIGFPTVVETSMFTLIPGNINAHVICVTCSNCVLDTLRQWLPCQSNAGKTAAEVFQGDFWTIIISISIASYKIPAFFFIVCYSRIENQDVSTDAKKLSPMKQNRPVGNPLLVRRPLRPKSTTIRHASPVWSERKRAVSRNMRGARVIHTFYHAKISHPLLCLGPQSVIYSTLHKNRHWILKSCTR